MLSVYFPVNRRLQLLRAAQLIPFFVIASPIFITEAHAEKTLETAPVIINGNSSNNNDEEIAAPTTSINGQALTLMRESNLGDMLKSIPGVTATSYGPAASRPILRGQDGEHMRIMQNGVGILDASALSPDHALAIDPLMIEKIDIIRGPAALRYGSNTIGGIVNAIDHRIPQDQLDGISGRGELRYGGADTQKNAAALLDAGNGVFALHADVFGRDSNNLSIPDYAKTPALRSPTDVKGTLLNSDARANGGALGGSVTLDNGYAGLSFSNFDNNYGSPAEETVRIQQNSQRWDLASEFTDLGAWIKRVKVTSAYTNYQHQEIESGTIGTTFKNQGLESGLEIEHQKIGRMQGMIGFQNQNSRFQALGAEAFLPKSNTLNQALYVYEELPFDLFNPSDFKLNASTRIENTDQDSQGGGKFGAAVARNFKPQSYAAGASYSFTPEWSLGTNLSHSERAPSYSELFANGPHLATGQFEIGNSQLGKEVSNGIDTQLNYKTETTHFNLAGYYNRFDHYITLANTGRLVDEDGALGGDLFESKIISVPATFKGIESQAKFRVYDAIGTLNLKLKGDYIRATNSTTGEPLPRIAPMHLGFGLDYQFNRLGALLDVLHGFKQDKVASNETPTDSYTQVNATLTWQVPSQYHLEAYAKATNLLDETIREHTSVIKDIAPLAGRSILFGLRGEF